MTSPSVFISYSHADEWLKDELLTHFSALKRNGTVSVWHDRMIPAGGVLKDEIDSRLEISDIFLLLISSNFLDSDYCFTTEYQAALDRRDRGEAEIVPIVVRDCDWDVGRLRTFNALPPDGIAVTRGALSKNDSQQRDAAWTSIIEKLKPIIEDQKKRLTPPDLSKKYLSNLFLVDFVRHPYMSPFDESRVLVESDVYYEKDKEQISTLDKLVGVISDYKAVLLTGADRSGKTVLAKRLQKTLCSSGRPTMILNGSNLRNADILRFAEVAKLAQFGLCQYPDARFSLIIDNFDECVLPDRVKETMVKVLCETFYKLIIVSYSNAPIVLFTSKELPDPAVLRLNTLTDDKIFLLVKKWKAVSNEGDHDIDDRIVLTTFERIQLIFNQTELDKLPYTVITFLELIDSATGSDIAFSSYAACYETLITNRLDAIGVSWRSMDEAKNFLALLAYKAYVAGGNGIISTSELEKSLLMFEKQFLSSQADLERLAVPHFLKKRSDGFIFTEDYIWFFLCARYVVKTLRQMDIIGYNRFIRECSENIFQKKYANIVIYISYFADDNSVLEHLLTTLDSLFSKSDTWALSDDSRELMLGFLTRDSLEIEPKADVSENRSVLLHVKVVDILSEAERMVANYTLPYLNSEIGDSDLVQEMDTKAIDADSYLKSVNALLRVHSVIGQILNGRSGTFSATFLLDCITRMVKASGRYAALNHAIATVLIYDKEGSLQDIDKMITAKTLTLEEKYEKVVRIFTFWSVYLSHAGLARYLSQEHAIRALRRLAIKFETSENSTSEGNRPFNFTLVAIIAKLYHQNMIDKDEIERCIQDFGEHSSLMSILRMVFHMYAFYMPMSYKDKQWISEKLNMSLQRIEAQSLKSVDSRKFTRLPVRRS